ncbi:Alpha/Beta hydrolase protein [Dactylonectria macrodidyma]|uniref:Alpha/Beta hydrolase protein n=1 Tax=Dactylonectria macrodidyma TaxID=307937 RepID=A0A9P9DCI1_9HYPO|nr:Alpha/Beta hydrolase protein [Dactylonectria macrodidyma]
MATLLQEFQGYQSQTFTYKVVSNLELKLDIMFPLEPGPGATPVLLHYHGGFLIIGNRHSLLPHWLIKACVSRKWIFATADYRLIPETTAHSSVEDAVDAYEWAVRHLPSLLNIVTGPVILAGSSAGAYLALTAASAGTNILGLPPLDSRPVLETFTSSGDINAPVLPGYAWPEDLLSDSRFTLIQAAHMEAQIPDMMTGVDGISEKIAKRGPEAGIAASERKLFPVAFGALSGLPPTMLLHGKNDDCVPFTVGLLTAEKLRRNGVEVSSEFLDDARHGFDVMLGPLDIEEAITEVTITPAIESLRKVLQFLDRVVG